MPLVDVKTVDPVFSTLEEATYALSAGNPGACLLYLKRLNLPEEPSTPRDRWVSTVAMRLRCEAEALLPEFDPIVEASILISHGRYWFAIKHLLYAKIHLATKVEDLMERLPIRDMITEELSSLPDDEFERLRRAFTALLNQKYNLAFALIIESKFPKHMKRELLEIIPPLTA